MLSLLPSEPTSLPRDACELGPDARRKHHSPANSLVVGFENTIWKRNPMDGQ